MSDGDARRARRMPTPASAGGGRGRLKVFIGMAAGVGKTYRMLLEGHAEQEAGRDVVIGLLETHGRAETAALAEGLEVVPRRRVDLPRHACSRRWTCRRSCARAPELCLIDELAHTNAPGRRARQALRGRRGRARRRHRRALDAQRPAPRVAQRPGHRAERHPRARDDPRRDRSRAPTRSCSIDLTPEALLERLRAGKVYPAERIDAALNNFFRIENLAALREVALRQVAEEVGRQAPRPPSSSARARRALAAEAPQAVGERLLALVEPYPGAQRLVRRAWRSAQRLGADLDLLWVRRPGQPLSEDAGALAGRAAPARLGARRDDARSRSPTTVAAAVVEVAARRGSTYILIGRSRPARGLARLRAPLPQRLMARLPGRRRADRRRPLQSRDNGGAADERSVDLHRRAPPASCSGSPPATGCRRTAAGQRATARGRCAGSCCRSPARRSRGARSRPRCASPRPRTRSIMPAFLARVPMNLPLEIAAARCSARAGCRCSRRSSSALTAQGVAGRLARRPRALRPRRAAQTARAGALRPHHRVGRRRPAGGAELRRSALAARARPGRDPDPAARPRRHAPDLGQASSAGTSEPGPAPGGRAISDPRGA